MRFAAGFGCVDNSTGAATVASGFTFAAVRRSSLARRHTVVSTASGKKACSIAFMSRSRRVPLRAMNIKSTAA